jgi:sarcosine oxidase subunit beta
MKRTDIAIIGAGLMGSSTALWLARAGKKVLLLEKEHHPCHASAVNAGGVRRLNRALEEIPLSVAAMELWHRLPSIVGSDCGFEPVGQVRIAPDNAAMDLLEHRVEQVRALGFDHEELVTAAEINRLVPAYAGRCSGGIVSRADGHASPARTLRAFYNAACAAGAEAVCRCTVADISRSENGFTIKSDDGRRFNSDVVINCAGAWGNRIASLVNDYLPMEPEALSMMVTARMPRFIRPVVGVHGRKLSFKQTADGTVVIGGAHRARLDMVREKTVMDFSEMKQSAATVLEHFPIMKQTTVVRCWAGIEGMMRDGLPAIGESPTTPGLFHVCGFSAHGFQLSPMVGRLAAALAKGRQPEIPLEAFSVKRFNEIED